LAEKIGCKKKIIRRLDHFFALSFALADRSLLSATLAGHLELYFFGTDLLVLAKLHDIFGFSSVLFFFLRVAQIESKVDADVLSVFQTF
jgi:hypothetical protein